MTSLEVRRNNVSFAPSADTELAMQAAQACWANEPNPTPPYLNWASCQVCSVRSEVQHEAKHFLTQPHLTTCGQWMVQEELYFYAQPNLGESKCHCHSLKWQSAPLYFNIVILLWLFLIGHYFQIHDYMP